MVFGWDKGLDYEKTYKLILNHYKNSKTDRAKGYDIILLTQLRNGSRVSESIAFLQQISRNPKDFKREAEIKVLKSKNKTRLMILPEEFTRKKFLGFTTFLQTLISTRWLCIAKERMVLILMLYDTLLSAI